MAEIIKQKGQRIPESAEISLLNCVDLSAQDVQSSVSLLKQTIAIAASRIGGEQKIDKEKSKSQKKKACLGSGFFYVINHGIDEEFMEEVFSQSKRFFDLPKEEKMKLLRNEKHRGYTPLFHQKLGDNKDDYYIGIEVSEDHPDAQKPFYGPNRWPSEDILPRWRETMEKYHKRALEVAISVSRLIAIALGLDVNFFDPPEMLGKAIAILRLLHYEDRASEPANGIFGATAHSDFGLITLLATDDNYGLQICKDKDAKPQIWEYVPPLKGAFIVNLGDMLERWSNGLFRSTLHRVLGNGQERYSIAFFIQPSHDCVVECLPTCHSENSPPKFPPVKCQDYLLQRYEDTHHANLSSYK